MEEFTPLRLLQSFARAGAKLIVRPVDLFPGIKPIDSGSHGFDHPGKLMAEQYRK